MISTELDHRMMLARRSKVNVVSVSYNAKYFYPRKLARTGACWDSLSDTSLTLMMDSAYKRDDVTNEDVIESAVKANASHVFPVDHIGKPEKTLHSTKEMLSLVESHPEFNAQVIPIIQPDHIPHYRQHEDFYSQFPKVALGALQKYSTQQQVKIAKEFRDVVGPYQKVHGFGIGTSLELIHAMRQHHLFDSIDVSTAETAIKNGKLLTPTMSQIDYKIPKTDERNGLKSGVQAQFTVAMLCQLNYVLSDLIDGSLTEVYEKETELGEISERLADIDIKSRHEVGIVDDKETPHQGDTLTHATTISQFES